MHVMHVSWNWSTRQQTCHKCHGSAFELWIDTPAAPPFLEYQAGGGKGLVVVDLVLLLVNQLTLPQHRPQLPQHTATGTALPHSHRHSHSCVSLLSRLRVSVPSFRFCQANLTFLSLFKFKHNKLPNLRPIRGCKLFFFQCNTIQSRSSLDLGLSLSLINSMTNSTVTRVRPKKKYCLFPISDRPYQNMCDPNLFYGFPKKKKKKKIFFFFFFQEIYKLRDDLLAVVKVTKKNVTKRRGGVKKRRKNKKSLSNVQIRHAWKWIWRQIK